MNVANAKRLQEIDDDLQHNNDKLATTDNASHLAQYLGAMLLGLSAKVDIVLNDIGRSK